MSDKVSFPLSTMFAIAILFGGAIGITYTCWQASVAILGAALLGKFLAKAAIDYEDYRRSKNE